MSELEEGEPAPAEEAQAPPSGRDVEAVGPTEGLARADIPDWVEGLWSGPEAEAEAAGPVETEGLLEGLRGVIPPASVIETPSAYEGMPSRKPSEASLARAKLMQGLLERPAERPQPRERERGVGFAELVQRWLVALVLLITVGGALIAPQMGFNIPELTQPIKTPAVIRSYNEAQELDESDTVLVAFEYGPVEADELDPVARPILDHILSQGANVSVVTTRPDGQMVASKLLGDMVDDTERYTTTQYAIQDYRAADATGVSQLLVAAKPQPTLLLVLTARPTTLRRWIEQASALAPEEIPVVAGLSAALEPVASPYLDVNAGQLTGAVYGLSGASGYEELRGADGEASRRLNALTAGHIAIIGLMVLGMFIYGFGGSTRRDGE